MYACMDGIPPVPPCYRALPCPALPCLYFGVWTPPVLGLWILNSRSGALAFPPGIWFLPAHVDGSLVY